MQDRKPLLTVFAWLLVPVWLGSTAWLFWVFLVRDMRPFASDPSPFARLQGAPGLPAEFAQLLRDLAEPGRPTVVQFRDTACRCDRLNGPHAERIREAFAPRGVRFVAVDARSRTGAGEGTYSQLPQRLSRWLPITASPAALVIDGEAQLAYFGPFSVGAACLSGSGDFVERTLERVLAGKNQRQFNVMDSGCYCDWPAVPAQPTGNRGLLTS